MKYLQIRISRFQLIGTRFVFLDTLQARVYDIGNISLHTRLYDAL